MEIIKNKSGKITSYREKVYCGNELLQKSFKRKTDAKSWKRKIESDNQFLIASGVSLESNKKLNAFYQMWIAKNINQNLAKRTIESYSSIYKCHIEVDFGELPLREIKLSHSTDLLTSLIKKSLSISRINDILKFFKHILGDAVLLDYLVSNPLKNVELLKVPEKEKQYWLKNEVLLFLDTARDDFYIDIYVTALNTGMRKGEILGLCWDAVNFKEKHIVVKRQLDRHGLKECTKSRKPRYISLNKTMIDLLLRRKKMNSMQYVFFRENGGPIEPSHFHKKFKKLIFPMDIKKIRFHDLRTTFACSWCINNGDIFALSKVLGHSSVDVTIKSYADLHPSYMAKVAGTVEFNPNDLKSNSPNLAQII